jgi:CDP-diacylglycerol pyrophosphatase
MRRLIVSAGLCFFVSGVLPTAWAADHKTSVFDRGILWQIVDNCLKDGGGANYCKNCPAPLPSLLASCTDPSGLDPQAICRETTEVWDQTSDFVAIRDQKMCGCPGDFVHGLALPLRKVTGVEDPSKPAGIWQFAWDEAVKKIGAQDKDAILIAANPRAQRSQDQLHIHLVRLADGARQKILDLRPIHIKGLSDVWTAAARHAAAGGLAEDGYGVSVVYDSAAGDFLVATSAGSLEKAFSSFSCSARASR